MELLTERNGSTLIVTLNRPERLNAVSLPLYRGLIDALREAERDRAVRAVVLTGAGRAFCVGADLKAHGEAELTREQRRAYVRTGQQAHRALQRCAKPIVAAVNGHAIGAGLELALSSDYVIVAANAKLRFPEIGLGTFVGGGTVYTLPRRAGLLRAKELLLFGDFFTPADAVEWGIANRVVDETEVLNSALEVARRLAEKAPVSLSYARRLLNEATHMDPPRALDLEARALLACMETADWSEGVRAFAEKRKPEFRGE
jgi:enoyl-CoA hydratase/carnithine racemase